VDIVSRPLNMLYKLAVALAIASASACDETGVGTCVAGILMKATPTDQEAACALIGDMITCISDGGCCDTAGMKDSLEAMEEQYKALGFDCTMPTCASAPCFGVDTHATLSTGQEVLMTSLKAGDYVLPGPTRVIVNQHAKASELTSTLLEIQHTEGALKLTPDHVLSVDGKFVAAREATVGTKLGESEVSRVTKSVGGIINPLTTSGKISAEGVLASTYPEWIAGFAMSYPIYLTAANLLSFMFPASTQSYYDAHLEQFFQSTVSSLKSVPAPLKALVFVVADLAVSAGLVLYTLASLKAVVAIAAVVAMTQTRK